MKMRYCILISTVISIIIGVIFSFFIEIEANIFCTLISFGLFIPIIMVLPNKAYKKDKLKGLIPSFLLGMISIYSILFAFCHKGEITAIFSMVLIIAFSISFLGMFLILLKK